MDGDHSRPEDLLPLLTKEDGVPAYVRLASVLLAIEEWLEKVGLKDLPGADELLEHLWEWPLLGPDSSDSWRSGGGPLLNTALGGTKGPDFTAPVKEAGLKPKVVSSILNCAAALVYDNLWTEADLEDNARYHQERLTELLEPWGVVPPQDLKPIRGGVTSWGGALSEQEVRKWRRYHKRKAKRSA